VRAAKHVGDSPVRAVGGSGGDGLPASMQAALTAAIAGYAASMVLVSAAMHAGPAVASSSTLER